MTYRLTADHLDQIEAVANANTGIVFIHSNDANALVAEVRRFRRLHRDNSAVERVARSLHFDRELTRTGGIEEDFIPWEQAPNEVQYACSGMAMRLILKAVQDDEQETR